MTSRETMDVGRIDYDLVDVPVTDTIHALAEKALEINRTFPEGTHCKEGMKPTGFMPPNKREKIIEILEEISKLTKQ